MSSFSVSGFFHPDVPDQSNMNLPRDAQDPAWNFYADLSIYRPENRVDLVAKNLEKYSKIENIKGSGLAGLTEELEQESPDLSQSTETSDRIVE